MEGKANTSSGLVEGEDTSSPVRKKQEDIFPYTVVEGEDTSPSVMEEEEDRGCIERWSILTEGLRGGRRRAEGRRRRG